MRLLTLVLAVFASTSMLIAQQYDWQPVAVEYTTGTVKLLASNNQQLYAWTSNGLFKGTENGAKWERIDFVFPEVKQIALSENCIFVLSKNGALWRSKDEGKTWEIPLPIKDNPSKFLVNNILSANGVQILANTGNDTLYRSTDNFTTLAPVQSISALRVNSDNLTTRIPIQKISVNLFFAKDSLFYMTATDKTDRRVPSDFFFTTIFDEPFISRDSGRTWVSNLGLKESSSRPKPSSSRFDLYWRFLQLVVNDSDAVWATSLTQDNFSPSYTAWGLYSSTNNGKTWATSSLNFLPVTYNDYHVPTALIALGNKILVADNRGFTYQLNGIDAQAQQFKIGKSPVSAFVYHQGTLIAGTLGDGFYASRDSGNTWQRSEILRSQTQSLTNVKSIKSVLFGSLRNGKVVQSTDNGTSWNVAMVHGIPITSFWYLNSKSMLGLTDSAGNKFFTIDGIISRKIQNVDSLNANIFNPVFNGSVMFAASPNRMYVSNDTGSTWKQAILPKLPESAKYFRSPFDTPLTWRFYPPVAMPIAKDFISTIFLETLSSSFICCPRSTITSVVSIAVRSDDNGNSWVLDEKYRYQGTYFPDAFPSSAFIRKNKIYGYGGFQSLDSGFTWKKSTIGCSSISDFAVIDSTIFSATTVCSGTMPENAGGVFASTDNGLSWESVNYNLPSLNVLSLVATDKTIFANTEMGTYRLTKIVQTRISRDDERERNPKNGLKTYPSVLYAGEKLQIQFSLEKKSLVRLSVYDTFGQLRENILEQEYAEGTHTREFIVKNLPSGMYFCHLIMAEQSRVEKFIVRK